MDWAASLFVVGLVCVNVYYIESADTQPVEGALDSSCIGPANCTVADSTCTGNTCKCKALFKQDGANCITTGELDASCSTAEDCTSTVHNSTCISNNTCQCASGFKRNGALCQKRIPSDTCAVTSDCSTLPQSECTDGKCTCVTGFQASESACELALGGACSIESDCGHLKHANCTAMNKTLECSCITGYTPTNNKCVDTQGGAADTLRAPSVVMVTAILGIVLAALGYI